MSDTITRPRKVAIVGFTPSRALAPYDDPDWEIWALNALYAYPDVKRVSRWFDLHPLKQIPEARMQQYAAMKIPVYLQERDPRVPQSIAFPKLWVEQRLRDRYFTNSIAWMQGLALAEMLDQYGDNEEMLRASAIHIYGVDMAQDTEYRFQRSCCEYWLGVAKGHGVESYVPETSDLLKALNQYGYEVDHGFRAKLKERLTDFNNRILEVQTAIGKHQEEINKLSVARHTLEGARQNVQWCIQSWSVADHRSMEPDHPEVEPPQQPGRVDQVREPVQEFDVAASPVVRIVKEG